MEELVIEREVPLPAKARVPTVVDIWPFGRMQVGESFATVKNRATVYSAIRAFKRLEAYAGMDFTARPIGDGKTRVWRTA